MVDDAAHGRTIEHVTLPIGGSRAARSEVPDDVPETLRAEVLLPALACGAVEVPDHPEYLLRQLLGDDGGLLLRLESADGGLVDIGIGWSDPGADRVWQQIVGELAAEEPQRPWCADVLNLDALEALGGEGLAVAAWSANLARCLAWALVPEETDEGSQAETRCRRQTRGPERRPGLESRQVERRGCHNRSRGPR